MQTICKNEKNNGIDTSVQQIDQPLPQVAVKRIMHIINTFALKCIINANTTSLWDLNMTLIDT